MEIERKSFHSLLLLFLLALLLQRPAVAAKKSYIVYLGSHSHSPEEASLLTHNSVVTSHYKFLGSHLGSEEKARDAIFYSYTTSINGFAANLEEEEAMSISKLPGVVSVFPNKGHKLHTTRSWDFLQLESNGRVQAHSLWNRAKFGEDIIVANLDTGVWPESESFKDEGMGPIPAKWRGICQKDKNMSFPCNRKLIGARYFSGGFKAYTGHTGPDMETPRDTEGHGTHTLSTAAGRFVPGASAFGYGKGTAKGGAPNARVASYKVCWPPVANSECFDVDILAGFDAAIHDGVHVLSVSLGSSPRAYFDDGLAVGSFHAIKNGITVVCSAGNSGPTLGTVSNLAPWIITVAASTLDREFTSNVYLKNGKRLEGQSVSSAGLAQKKFYPLVSGIGAKARKIGDGSAQLCLNGSLDPAKVKGKIVVCVRGMNSRAEKGENVRQAGGVGMILVNDEANGDDLLSDPHVLPAIHISYSDGSVLFSYLNSTRSPFGYISTPTTNLGTYPAPRMASFSSQGPNAVDPGLLKPDITAPGVNIIAAFSEAAGPTDQPFDSRRVPFNLMSGTSMSCPHVSGVVALLKAVHPDWSPSAIKSAIMTSARTRDNMKEPIINSSLGKATPFSYGSGHLQPNRAVQPGLVYDLTTEDYLDFLCSIGYSATQLDLFLGRAYVCPTEIPVLANFNYPSITVYGFSGEVTVKRVVKNVGTPGTYRVRVKEPAGVSVSVEPKVLEFKQVGQEKTFNVSFKATGRDQNFTGSVFGGLVWSDGKHYVRSPIVLLPLL